MPNTKILAGDCIQTLKQLPDASVNCCVTSPPYFGLRDYGTATWEGGDPNCKHIGVSKKGTNRNFINEDGRMPNNACISSGDCKICGAKRIDDQIGLEETPEEFVAKLVAVFREVRRVLKDDGTCWVNMGDSYAGSGKGPAGNLGKEHDERNMEKKHSAIVPLGTKPKDLIGIPWMLAFALRADGWYLRQDIIWHKPNPMPESVTDRCTKAHEYIFLLSKSRQYYFDSDLIRTPLKENTKKGVESGWNCDRANISSEGSQGIKVEKMGTRFAPEKGANKRSVWSVNTHSYREAHFATYPPDLIKPCILAGCPVGGVVLDPFGGSGTTAQVAMENERDAILCELNPDYIKIIEKRLGEIDPLFTQSV
jgi:DNA modification methylase